MSTSLRMSWPSARKLLCPNPPRGRFGPRKLVAPRRVDGLVVSATLPALAYCGDPGDAINPLEPTPPRISQITSQTAPIGPRAKTERCAVFDQTDESVFDASVRTFRHADIADHRPFLLDPATIAFAAIDGPDVIGWARGTRRRQAGGSSQVQLYEIGVVEARRGQGVGRALINSFPRPRDPRGATARCGSPQTTGTRSRKHSTDRSAQSHHSTTTPPSGGNSTRGDGACLPEKVCPARLVTHVERGRGQEKTRVDRDLRTWQQPRGGRIGDNAPRVRRCRLVRWATGVRRRDRRDVPRPDSSEVLDIAVDTR
jgi:GNAT superfamily N-acetyltransferase